MNCEDREEAMRDVFESRRREFLRDMSVRELQELIPAKEKTEPDLEDGSDIFTAAVNYKEHLIDIIVENYFDKQCNPEVK